LADDGNQQYFKVYPSIGWKRFKLNNYPRGKKNGNKDDNSFANKEKYISYWIILFENSQHNYVSKILQQLEIIAFLVKIFLPEPHGMLLYWNTAILGKKAKHCFF
jgi:hypothetical protein